MYRLLSDMDVRSREDFVDCLRANGDYSRIRGWSSTEGKEMAFTDDAAYIRLPHDGWVRTKTVLEETQERCLDIKPRL